MISSTHSGKTNLYLMENNFFLEDRRLKNETQFEAFPHLLPNIFKFLNHRDIKSLGLACCSLYNRMGTDQFNQLRIRCCDLFKIISLSKGCIEKIPVLNKEYNKIAHNKNIIRKEFINLFQEQMFSKIKLLLSRFTSTFHIRTEEIAKLFKILAEVDLKKAYSIANSLKDVFLKLYALLEIAKKDPRIPQIFEQLHAAADSIGHPEHKAKALVNIAKVEALVDIEQARTTVNSIEHIFSDAQLLTEIAKMEAKCNLLEHAYATVDSIPSEGEKSNAMIEIVRVVARNNLEKAHSIAETFSKKERNRALSNIIIVAGMKIDLDRAHAIADSITLAKSFWHRSNWKDRALCEIAKREAEMDIELAKKTADAIIDTYDKANAYLRMAEIDPKYLKSVHDCYPKICDFDVIKLAVLEARMGKTKKAHDTLERYIKGDNLLKRIGTMDVHIETLKIQAKTSLNKAFRTIELIKDNDWKAQAYIEIFKVRLQSKRPNFKSCKRVIFKAWDSSLSPLLKLNILVYCLLGFKSLK